MHPAAVPPRRPYRLPLPDGRAFELVATIGAVLFAIAVVLYVLAPLFSGREAALDPTDAEVADAHAWQTVALRALRDVEYDYHTGKLDAADYAALKSELTVEAVEALRRAEAAGEPGADTGQMDDLMRRVHELVERGVLCSSCAHHNPAGSRFCASCGRSLESPDGGAARTA